MKRTATAEWRGGLQDGAGTLTTQSGVLKGDRLFVQDVIRGRHRNQPRRAAGGCARGMLHHGAVDDPGPGRAESRQAANHRDDLARSRPASGFSITQVIWNWSPKFPARPRTRSRMPRMPPKRTALYRNCSKRRSRCRKTVELVGQDTILRPIFNRPNFRLNVQAITSSAAG